MGNIQLTLKMKLIHTTYPFRNTTVFQAMKFMSWLKIQKKRFSDTVILQDIQ